MSAYIRSLNQHTEQPSTQAASSLRERLMNWLATLPAVARERAFAMSEFELALGTQGRYISPVLLELGWQRHRRWSTKKQYHRVWLPPA